LKKQPTPELSYSTTLARDYSFIRFERGPGFKKELTNPDITIDGRSIGEKERALLHEKLDFWIEENLK
jgi:hypothetical protein